MANLVETEVIFGHIKACQFKPGTSGNPKGRPKLVQDFKTDFQDELEETITLKEGGSVKTMTKQRAFCAAMRENFCPFLQKAYELLNEYNQSEEHKMLHYKDLLH